MGDEMAAARQGPEPDAEFGADQSTVQAVAETGRGRISFDLSDRPGDIATQDDQTLLIMTGKGNKAAFEELFRRYRNAAWATASAITRNGSDAEDAVAQAFAKVYRRAIAGGIDDGASFRPYLLLAVKRVAYDIVKQRRRTEPWAEIDLRAPAQGLSPLERVVAGEEELLIAEAFPKLPDRYREILVLTELAGLAHGEIATMLDLTKENVAQLAFRARRALRELFLQAHLRGPVAVECAFTVEHLGAWVTGGLSRRDQSKVAAHLDVCVDCRAREAEVREVGAADLTCLVLPVTAGLAAAIWSKVRAVRRARRLVLAAMTASGLATGAVLFAMLRPGMESLPPPASPATPPTTAASAPANADDGTALRAQAVGTRVPQRRFHHGPDPHPPGTSPTSTTSTTSTTTTTRQWCADSPTLCKSVAVGPVTAGAKVAKVVEQSTTCSNVSDVIQEPCDPDPDRTNLPPAQSDAPMAVVFEDDRNTAP